MEWLVQNGHGDMVKPAKPTLPTVDKLAVRKLVKMTDYDGAILVSADGVKCDDSYMTATIGVRRFSVDTDI